MTGGRGGEGKRGEGEEVGKGETNRGEEKGEEGKRGVEECKLNVCFYLFYFSVNGERLRRERRREARGGQEVWKDLMYEGNF